MLQDIRKHEATAGTRVLMLTGSGELEHVRRASALRADGYLVKPVRPAAVVERLKALLG